jgi:hypothetical protein
LLPLDPGKSLVFREVWKQRTDAGRPVEPGEYRIRGVLLTDDPDGLSSNAARLSIAR